MHWRLTQVALRRHLRTAYDAKLAAQLSASPTLEELAAAHEVAKRHALATAEGPFETGPSGPVRTTARTDRAARQFIERAAASYAVDADALREVRDSEQARVRDAFLRAPATRAAADHRDSTAARRPA